MITFHAPEPLVAGATMILGESVAHHARVLRLEPGQRVRLSDGAGTTSDGSIARIQKSSVSVDVGEVTTHGPPRDLHVMVPIGDRDRMLWLAEKMTELGVASWRPVMYRRSRSVSPRGEGAGFQNKARARAVSALEQSGAAWLPVFYPDATLDRSIAITPAGTRLLLDPAGEPIAGVAMSEPVTIALGPEGGLDPAEREQLVAAGFRPTSLGDNILRFETAAVAGVAIVGALLRDEHGKTKVDA